MPGTSIARGWIGVVLVTDDATTRTELAARLDEVDRVAASVGGRISAWVLTTPSTDATPYRSGLTRHAALLAAGRLMAASASSDGGTTVA